VSDVAALVYWGVRDETCRLWSMEAPRDVSGEKLAYHSRTTRAYTLHAALITCSGNRTVPVWADGWTQRGINSNSKGENGKGKIHWLWKCGNVFLDEMPINSSTPQFQAQWEYS